MCSTEGNSYIPNSTQFTDQIGYVDSTPETGRSINREAFPNEPFSNLSIPNQEPVRRQNDSTKSVSTATTTTIERRDANSISQRSANSQHPPEDADPNSFILLVQQKLFENYHLIAYTLIIGTYFIAFCEYLYLRLISIIFPERIVYKQTCAKHANETIVRNEIHYASATIIFLVIAIFQLVCFFLLTVSGKWLDVRRSFSTFMSMEERLRHELAFALKRVMFTTVFPAFSVVICAIFYMVGIRDPVQHVGSQVLIYFFDGCVLAYFLAFPIICLLYHPEIQCCSKKNRLQVPVIAPLGADDGKSGSGAGIANPNVQRRRMPPPPQLGQSLPNKTNGTNERTNRHSTSQQQQSIVQSPFSKRQTAYEVAATSPSNVTEKQTASPTETARTTSNTIERTLQRLPNPAEIGQQSRRLLRFDHHYRRLSDSEIQQPTRSIDESDNFGIEHDGKSRGNGTEEKSEKVIIIPAKQKSHQKQNHNKQLKTTQTSPAPTEII